MSSPLQPLRQCAPESDLPGERTQPPYEELMPNNPRLHPAACEGTAEPSTGYMKPREQSSKGASVHSAILYLLTSVIAALAIACGGGSAAGETTDARLAAAGASEAAIDGAAFANSD